MKKETKAALMLTPILLATSPITVGAGEPVSSYSHQAQAQVFGEGSANGNRYPTNTFGGTQTFDHRGQPYDSDSDSDENSF